MGQSLASVPGLPLEKTDQEFDFMNFVYWMAGYNVTPTDTIPIFKHGSNWPAFIVGPEGSKVVRTLDLDNDNDLVTLLFGEKIPDMQSEGLGYINANETEAMGILFNSATLAATSVQMAEGAKAAGAAAQAFYVAADSAENAGDPVAADSLRTLGNQKATEAQQLASDAQDYYNQFLATVPAAMQAAPKVANPIPTEYVLDRQEVILANKFTGMYNGIIKSFAEGNADIAVFDANQLLEQVKDGVFVDGLTIDGSFLTGNAFSLDGVHLTPQGYALVANEIIGVINESFNATVPPVNVNEFRGVVFP
jgi:lysophospholipase L1-like esterase